METLKWCFHGVGLTTSSNPWTLWWPMMTATRRPWGHSLPWVQQGWSVAWITATALHSDLPVLLMFFKVNMTVSLNFRGLNFGERYKMSKWGNICRRLLCLVNSQAVSSGFSWAIFPCRGSPLGCPATMGLPIPVWSPTMRWPFRGRARNGRAMNSWNLLMELMEMVNLSEELNGIEMNWGIWTLVILVILEVLGLASSGFWGPYFHPNLPTWCHGCCRDVVLECDGMRMLNHCFYGGMNSSSQWSVADFLALKDRIFLRER